MSNQNDHDILITLVTKVEGLSDKIEEMSQNIIKRLERVEIQKFSASDAMVFKSEQEGVNQDHEGRIRALEKFYWGAIAVLAIVNFIGVGGLFYLIEMIKK